MLTILGTKTKVDKLLVLIATDHQLGKKSFYQHNTNSLKFKDVKVWVASLPHFNFYFPAVNNKDLTNKSSRTGLFHLPFQSRAKWLTLNK